MVLYEFQLGSVNGRKLYPLIVDEKGKAVQNGWDIDAILGVSNHPSAGNVDIDFNELCRDIKAARGRYLVAVYNGGIMTYQRAIKNMTAHKVQKGKK